MMAQNIGMRIRSLRLKRGLSQDDLARMFGFKDRQTVSAIENGIRRVTAAELLLAADKLEASLDYFTDPFLLDGEEKFSWRQTEVDRLELAKFEQTASRWIGAYRNLAAQVGREAPLMRQALGLTKSSSFENAAQAGERFAVEFNLGEVPATCLAGAMQDQLGIVVLMVDACQGISGAACRLPELDAVLIARGEVEGRRNFDLAHELFHILTWEAMPPEHVENARDFGGRRVEQLANNFATAVLMPAAALQALGDCNALESNELIACLNTSAEKLKVTSSALRWRLVARGQLNKARAQAIPESALQNNGRKRNNQELPALFSRPYLGMMAAAIDRGFVSVRRVSGLLGLTVEGLEELFSAHNLDKAITL